MKKTTIKMLLVSTLISTSFPLCTPRKDPATDRVRVLYFGDPIGASPFPFMLNEPLLATVPIMACKMWHPYESIRKSMRVYMPRSFGALNESCDLVILSDANVLSFETKHLDWFLRLVGGEGAGLAMIGGFESFGGYGYLSWGPTEIGDMLPVNCLPGAYNAGGEIVIVKPDCPVVSNLPWDTLGPSNYLGGNKVTQKDGSELIARFSDSNPLWVWWNFGKGRSFAMAGDWTPAGGTAFMKWTYYGDFAINVVLFTSGERVPAEIEAMHSVRSILRRYSDTKAFLYSLMDFAEKFGANMKPIERSIGQAEKETSHAKDLYMCYEFDDATSSAARALEILDRSLDAAILAKDRAMLWVFLIEWAAVISTCMISGTVVYQLMIARKLLRSTPSSIFTKGYGSN